MKRYKHHLKHSGFTLIEILTVITIIAILSAIGFGTYLKVIKQTKATQAKAMIENISSNLEMRVTQGFSEEEITALGGVIDPVTLYPIGDGTDASTENLYAVLSGDYTLTGQVDDDRKPMFAQIDPQYSGKGQYLIMQSASQLNAGRDTSKLIIVDPWNQPLRYKSPGDKNNVENGFDIWSIGPDGADFEETNGDGEDGGLDNITNW